MQFSNQKIPIDKFGVSWFGEKLIVRAPYSVQYLEHGLLENGGEQKPHFQADAPQSMTVI
ncbi:hypothetical protein [Alkanindiges illinoisensis]|uniref:hypothetical protein n=1 Tax=Alkanindiges illinoisensis TaxID=197183 RepID=UPI00047C52E3|nr:hypothetical protein [Alkanindiges illinoisensis]